MNPEFIRRLLAVVGRYVFAAICSGIVIVSIGVAIYFLQDASLLQSDYDTRSTQGEGMRATRKIGPTLRTELSFVREAVQKVEANLIDKDDIAGNQTYFESFEKVTRARLENATQSTPLQMGSPQFYQSVPFNVRISGTYAQVHAYLYAIETGARLANITSFVFQRVPQTEGNISLEMNLELLARSHEN